MEFLTGKKTSSKVELRSDRRERNIFFPAFDSITCIFSPPRPFLLLLPFYLTPLPLFTYISLVYFAEAYSSIESPFSVRSTFLTNTSSIYFSFLYVKQTRYKSIEESKDCNIYSNSIIILLQIISLLLFCKNSNFLREATYITAILCLPYIVFFEIVTQN